MLTLIEHGNLYTPAPAGEGSLLIAGETVLAVGAIDATAVASLGMPLRRIDAAGRIICPGFIDPHEHIIGGAGEDGFGTRTSEVTVEEIVTSGVTTVIGLLGTDTISRHLTSLLAKARQLEDDGMSAWIYTGGFPVPTPTITGSVQRDLVIVDKVIGVGEIAIADDRVGDEPSRRSRSWPGSSPTRSSAAGSAASRALPTFTSDPATDASRSSRACSTGTTSRPSTSTPRTSTAARRSSPTPRGSRAAARSSTPTRSMRTWARPSAPTLSTVVRSSS